jgi:hypothetical protein
MALSYNMKRTGTVLRLSYARTLESPFNENLVIFLPRAATMR